MPLGMILLVVVGVLIYLGFAQRILDKLRLTDKQAFIFIAAILIGGFLPDIPLTENVGINIGGGIIPVILIVYLLVKADTVREKRRAVIALLITTVIVYGATKVVPIQPTQAMLLDPMYIFALIAGITGYLAGRSRRSAFIAGAGSMVLVDIVSRIELALMGIGGRGAMVIGGAGAFDAIVISGIIAVALAELIGETREKLQGGTSKAQITPPEHEGEQGKQEYEQPGEPDDDNPEKQDGE